VDHLTAPLIAWVQAHAAWAPLIAFAITFVESVPLIGIFIPGSAILIGIGLLIGAGVLPPLPVLAGAFVGAVLGDALGFWLCRWLGPGFVRRHLPRGYRRSYARGVLAFRRWGMWTVFIARFVSPLRAVTPLIAGVTRMRQWPFQIANIGSALVWVPLLLVPGSLAGWAGAVLGDRADPLVLVLVGIAVAGTWLSLRAVWVRSGQPG
jgi:membrane protein DedA with SNARE-associated domain